ncbi:TPA: fimbria/pilus outer membrane usher protein, partial [Escherichia coli]
MPDHSLFRLRVLPWYIALAISGSYASAWADDDIQFDSRFLELKGDTKIDLKRFSSQGYVEPGKYNLTVQVNKQPLPDEYDIFWYASEKEAGKTYACLTPALLAQFGLKEEIAKNLQWSRNGECLAPGQLEGIDIKADLSQSALLISLPQAYLEYSDMDWDPPSRWDDGIPGLIADYSINAQTRSGDDDEDSDGNSTQRNWEWSRYYAWRALPSLKAKLALGEDYLNSDIFDGFNYVGGSVSTDDQMLPPNLRGYAPDISGVAHTTAKVTVSQMGRVIYETQVPAGPFRIQDLGDSVSGTLHVRIEEQNGQVQEYDISTASMPFLTRQGQVRYKVMMGRPQEWGHNIVGGFFSGGEASWGIANGWSLYGGALADENYQSAAIGVGRDLSVFGAMAFDVTHSHVRLDENTAYDNRTLDGNSFRVSYAKDFDELDSRVTFAGYRF